MQIPEIKKIADSISASEKRRKNLADFIKVIAPEFNLVEKVTPANLESMKIAGVDGGIVKSSVHGFDFILTKAVGVCFNFRDGKVNTVDYFPSKNNAAKPFALEASSEVDFMHFSSIIRQHTEIQIAIDCIDKFNPNVLLLDGQIYPHYLSKPSETSSLFVEYEKLLKLYEKLYVKARQSKIVLAGVVEDSRSDKFCNLIAQNITKAESINLLQKSRDTNLLFWILEKNERTQSFSNAMGNIFSFYLKTAKYDRPVRVDFLDKSQEEKLASIILSISSQHSGYGYPTVLIEADNVAKLSEQEIDNFYSLISKYTGNLPSLMRLRRDQRPF